MKKRKFRLKKKGTSGHNTNINQTVKTQGGGGPNWNTIRKCPTVGNEPLTIQTMQDPGFKEQEVYQ